MFTEKKLAFVAIIIGWSLFIPQQVSAASPCPIGFQLSPTAPDIDGDLGTQWTDAYVLDSDTSPCLADLSDTGGARDLTIYSKRYARGAQNFIGLFFQVIDSTFCSDPKLFISGKPRQEPPIFLMSSAMKPILPTRLRRKFQQCSMRHRPRYVRVQRPTGPKSQHLQQATNPR